MTRSFLADEHVKRVFVTELRANGYDIAWVDADYESGTSDRAHLKQSGESNRAILSWKRVERLAHEYRPAELRERIDALIEEDDALRERFGVPDPDVVTSGDLLTEDHDAIHEHWEAVGEWRTVRRDLRVPRRALDRAEASSGDGARA